jgi:hypothetical protein
VGVSSSLGHIGGVALWPIKETSYLEVHKKKYIKGVLNDIVEK